MTAGAPIQDETNLLETARTLRPTIEAYAEQIERESALPGPLVATLAAAGLFTMLVPREFGGTEITPATYVRAIEEISRADGSVGWCVHVGGSCSLAAGWLAPEAARAIWDGDARAYVAGATIALGAANVVPGGYQVSGRWGFASGCPHATWLCVTVRVIENGDHRTGPNGLPETLFAFLPRRDFEILDTWHVTGMRGTGSHDVVVNDAFVPDHLTLPRSSPMQSWNDAPLYAFGAGAVKGGSGALGVSSPWVGVFAPGLAAVCLGVARGALDAFATLAATKTPTRRNTVLRDDPIVQTMFGRAEARLRGARSYLYATVADLWRTVQGIDDDTEHESGLGARPSDRQAMVQLASVHAAETAVEVVQTLWRAAGTSAIPAGSPLDRCLRDVLVASQNVAINPMHITTNGRLLLERGA